MKTKIFILLLLFSSFCFTSVQAQWQMVYDSGSRGPQIFGDGKNVILRNDFGMAISKDSGTTWKQVDTSKGLRSAGGFIRKDSFLLVTTQTSIYRSLDSGQTWNFLNNWPTWGNTFGTGFWLSGNNILSFGEFDRVIISKDNGFSWDSSNLGLPPSRIDPMKIRSFYGLANSGNNMLAFYDGDLYISYNHGESWFLKRKNLPLITYRIYSIGNSLFAGGPNLFKSRDSGSNWNIVFSAKSILNAIGSLRTNGKIIIGGVQQEGVIISKDSGNNWIYINDGLTTFNLSDFTITFDYIYSAAVPGKVFRRSIVEVLNIKGENKKSDELLQLKTYPNPLKHSATIEFGRKLKNGEIRIYNISGQEVQTLKNIKSDGVKIYRNNLPSGTYFYDLTEGNKKLATGKLIIE